MKDVTSNSKTVQAIVPAVKSAAADGATIDVRGFGSLLFAVTTGAVAGDGDFAVKVQDSDNGSDWTDADAGDVHGTVPATLAADTTYKVGYGGGSRYARLALTKAAGTSIALGAVAVLGHPAIAPVA